MAASPWRTAAKHSHSSRRATPQQAHIPARVAHARNRWTRGPRPLAGIASRASSNSCSDIVGTCMAIDPLSFGEGATQGTTGDV